MKHLGRTRRGRLSARLIACTLAFVGSCDEPTSKQADAPQSCSPPRSIHPPIDRNDAAASAMHADAATGASGEMETPPPGHTCDDEPKLLYGPVLGAMTDRSVKIWAKADHPGVFFVDIWPQDEPERLRTIEGPRFPELDNSFSVALIEGLRPDTRYGYRLRLDECTCPNNYSFKTLPAAGEPTRIRFATAGDIEGPDIPGFADIAAVGPAFVLMVGDNVYADGRTRNESGYRMRYESVWDGPQFRELFSHVPTFMIWDDHELIDNYWQGKNDDVYAFGRRLYDEYQGSHNPDPLVEGELYYTFEAGDIGFFVLDTRSHRSPNTEPDGPYKSMLGDDQKQRLLSWLSQNRYQVHVILSSVLMSDFSTTGNDAWSAFRSEREEILEHIASEATRHVIVISGDQHWSAILRLDRGEPPYSIYEFEATPLGFSERGAPADVDDRVLALDNTHQVFSTIDIDTRVDPPTIDYTLCAVGRACRPHQEPGPMTEGSVTTVPYSVGFEGKEGGFELVSGL